jgi:uncharacterized protein YggE
MRSMLFTVPAAALALGLAGIVGVASAQTPLTATPTPRVITVSGYGFESAPYGGSGLPTPAQKAAYKGAITKAFADARENADVVAAAAGLGVGVVQTIQADSGASGCPVQAESDATSARGAKGKGRRVVARPRTAPRPAGTQRSNQVAPGDACQVPAYVTVTFLIA